jgi:hypothetical protein
VSILGETLSLLVDQNQNLQASLGVQFEFASGTRRIWRGSGRIKDQDDNVWEPIGQIGTISGLQLGIGEVTEPLTMELSGLDPTFMSISINQATELKGRDCTVYLMVFNEDWSLAARPVALRTAVMDRIVRKFSMSNKLVGITLYAENFLVTRFRSPNGYLTHADQQARFPTEGDRGLERISGYTGPARVLYWS